MVFAAQSGMGKSSAAAVLLKAYRPIVDQAYIISSTLHLDPAYQEPMRLLKESTKKRVLKSMVLKKIRFMKTCQT